MIFKRIILLLLITALVLPAGISALAVPPAVSSDGEDGVTEMIPSGTRCKSYAADFVTLDDIPARTAGRRVAAKGGTVQKTIPLAVIVIGLDNAAYDNSLDWNEVLFSGEKSLGRYYTDMSQGKFTFTPAAEISEYGTGGNTNIKDKSADGIIHVNLNLSHRLWDGDNNVGSMMEAFVGAINESDKYINYAQYDADGDGFIENNEMALGFVVSGYERAYSPNGYTEDGNLYLWSHAWSVIKGINYAGINLATPRPDGVTVSDYIAIPEYLERKGGENITESISVIAHELGHYLGLPDLYDTNGSLSGEWKNYNPQYLSVMCDGSWVRKPDGSVGPCAFDAWCKYKLGWIEPEIAAGRRTYTLNADGGNSGYNAVLIPTQRQNEYFLLENRQFTGWDAGLENYYANSGAVIWHIDDAVYEKYKGNETVNTSDHRPAVTPLYMENKKVEDPVTGKLVNSTTMIGTQMAKAWPFFNKTVYDKYYAADLGDRLYLPLYGEGDAADKKRGRTLSDTALQFPDESAASMTVKVLFPYVQPDPDIKNSGYGQYNEEKSGIRVFFDLKTGACRNGYVSEIGGIVRDDSLSTGGMTVNTAGELVNPDGQQKVAVFRDGKQTGNIYSDDGTRTAFNLFLINLRDKDRTYSFRGYAIIESESGEGQVIYTDSYKEISYNTLSK